MHLTASGRLPGKRSDTEQPEQQTIGAELNCVGECSSDGGEREGEDCCSLRGDPANKLVTAELHQQEADQGGQPEGKWVDAEEAEPHEGETVEEEGVD